MMSSVFKKNRLKWPRFYLREAETSSGSAAAAVVLLGKMSVSSSP